MKKGLWILGFLLLFMGTGILGCNDDDNRLTINIEGNGTGTVISESFDINCDSDCTYDISEDETVTLTAAAGEGSVFVGWSGEDCSGTGDCMLTMDENKTVTATFVKSIGLNETARYATGIFDESASEIVAHDPETDRIFVVNGDSGKIDVLDGTIISDANGSSTADMEKITDIDLSPYGKGANSVAFKNGVLAAAVENEDKQSAGQVVFFDAEGNFLNAVSSGVLPDMVKFSPDGNTVLAANEGEPDDDYTIDPEGSVTIVDISGGVANATSTIVNFTAFNDQEDELKDQGIRIFSPDATVAEDLEPEYIAVSSDSRTAWICLQENNALAELDIETATITRILPLGFKDHSLSENSMDASNKDDQINLATWPVLGMYQPDSIVAFEIDGETYLATANEGDSRDYDAFSEEERVEDLTLDETAFPLASELQNEEQLGRLKITTTLGDTDNDGDYDELYSYGARSFSIWKPTESGLELVFDSADDFETITASLIPDLFNANNDENEWDARSDDKGPEPEGIDVGQIDGRTYVFVGLERVGGIMVYDVTRPESPVFVTYLNNRDVNGDPEAGTAGDLGPEGILFVDAADSPNDKPLLVVGNEVSGSTTVYTIEKF